MVLLVAVSEHNHRQSGNNLKLSSHGDRFGMNAYCI